MALQVDRKILVGSRSYVHGMALDGYIERFNADGTRDETFEPLLAGGNDGASVDCMLVQPDGKSSLAARSLALARSPMFVSLG
jgi:hypothetical protein